jgi:hypothetical protein
MLFVVVDHFQSQVSSAHVVDTFPWRCLGLPALVRQAVRPSCGLVQN